MRQSHISSSKRNKGSKSKREPLINEVNAAEEPQSSEHLDSSRRPKAPGLVVDAAERAEALKRRARYDRPGHIDDAHAERLRHLSQNHSERRELAFVLDSRGDELATELAEQAVTSMVGGGETWLDTVNAQFEEEDGGPFVETRSAREFAAGSDDESEGFLREALPTASARPVEPIERVRMRRRR